LAEKEYFFAELENRIEPLILEMIHDREVLMVQEKVNKINELIEEMAESLLEAYYRRVDGAQYRQLFDGIAAKMSVMKPVDQNRVMTHLIKDPLCSAYFNHDLLDYWSEQDAGMVDTLLTESLMEACTEIPKRSGKQLNQVKIKRICQYIKDKKITKKIGEKIEKEFTSKAFMLVNNGYNKLIKEYYAIMFKTKEDDFALHNIISCHRNKILKMFEYWQEELNKL